MASFAYKAINKKGEEMTGIVDAENLALAINQVRSLGYFPTKVSEATASDRRRVTKTKKRSGFYIGGVKSKQVTLFTRQLSTLIDAGLPLMRSLNVLESQLTPCKLKDIIIAVAEDVQSGSTLSEALAKHPKAFDRLYVNMVRAGEIGGMLEVVLNRLAEFAEKRQALIRQVRGALIYPIVVLTIAGAVVGIIMVKVVPTFQEIFKDFGAALPPTTTFLLEAAKFLKSRWYILIGYIFGIIVFFKLIFKIPPVKKGFDIGILKVPLIGSLVTKVNVARFARTLGTLVTSGVPILQSLRIVKDTLSNVKIANAIQKVHDSVREGETIAAPLEESKVFPSMVVNMIDVGEETGSLDQMLIKVADVYDDEVEIAVQAMLRLMEPVMIVVLGCIVGFIVISLYLPIFSLADTLSSPQGSK